MVEKGKPQGFDWRRLLMSAVRGNPVIYTEDPPSSSRFSWRRAFKSAFTEGIVSHQNQSDIRGGERFSLRRVLTYAISGAVLLPTLAFGTSVIAGVFDNPLPASEIAALTMVGILQGATGAGLGIAVATFGER